MHIRKATLSDAPAIADHLLSAMEELVYQFLGTRDFGEAQAFLRHFAAQENNQYSFRNCHVAEMDGVIAGSANAYDGADLHLLRQPVINYIRSRYDPFFEPEDETQAGEYYLDTIGVAPAFRGRGIGSRLLETLIETYVIRKGGTLGLLVDEDNPGAKKLYLKMGFQPTGTRLLFGKSMEHLQHKG